MHAGMKCRTEKEYCVARVSTILCTSSPCDKQCLQQILCLLVNLDWLSALLLLGTPELAILHLALLVKTLTYS